MTDFMDNFVVILTKLLFLKFKLYYSGTLQYIRSIENN